MGKLLDELIGFNSNQLKNVDELADFKSNQLKNVDEVQLENEIKENISNKILEFQALTNKSQTYIAECVGVTQGAVNQWISKSSAPKSFSTIVRLAVCLQCSVDELLFGTIYTEEDEEEEEKDKEKDKDKKGPRKIKTKKSLTNKSSKLLKTYTLEKSKPLWKPKSENKNNDNIPSFDRIVNYLICKDRNELESYDGEIFNIQDNMLLYITNEIKDILHELNKIKEKPKNKNIQNLSYKELKDKSLIPNSIITKIQNLPNMIELYIEDEYNGNIDSIIGKN